MESQSTHFHGSIFVPPYYPTQFCKNSTLNFQNRESLKANIAVNDRLSNNEITKGNKAGSSAKKDSEGNEEVEVHYERENKDENGNTTSSFGVSGGAKKDESGNTVYEVEGRWDIHF